MLSVGLARFVPAVALKHVEAAWDGGISFSSINSYVVFINEQYIYKLKYFRALEDVCVYGSIYC